MFRPVAEVCMAGGDEPSPTVRRGLGSLSRLTHYRTLVTVQIHIQIQITVPVDPFTETPSGAKLPKEGGAGFRLFWLTWLQATWGSMTLGGGTHQSTLQRGPELVSAVTDATSPSGHVCNESVPGTLSTCRSCLDPCRRQDGHSLELRCPWRVGNDHPGRADAVGRMRAV